MEEQKINPPFELELKNFHCQIKSHLNSPYIAFCVDPNCLIPNKFSCFECIFDCHSGHKLVKIEEIDKLIKENYDNIKKKKEQNDTLLSIYLKLEEEKKKEIESLKEISINLINEKINNFLQDMQKKSGTGTFLSKKKNEADYTTIGKIMNANISPPSSEDFEKFSKLCFEFYKIDLEKPKSINIPQNPIQSNINNIRNENDLGFNIINNNMNVNNINNNILINNNVINNINNNNNNNKNTLAEEDLFYKSKAYLESPEFSEKLQKFIQVQFQNFSNFLTSDFFPVPNELLVPNEDQNFEWSQKTYSGYGFYYSLDQTKRIAVKSKGDGTMTILRAKDKIEVDCKYVIEFKVIYEYGGDLDIGIGTDYVGNICWLRDKRAICISNSGIINRDQKIINGEFIKNGNTIKIEIDRCPQQNCRIIVFYVNNEKITSLPINFTDEDIYIMAAIRKVGNSIEVINYERKLLY